jgi:hypothetical protein
LVSADADGNAAGGAAPHLPQIGAEIKTCIDVFDEINKSNGGVSKGKASPEDLLMVLEWFHT